MNYQQQTDTRYSSIQLSEDDASYNVHRIRLHELSNSFLVISKRFHVNLSKTRKETIKQLRNQSCRVQFEDCKFRSKSQKERDLLLEMLSVLATGCSKLEKEVQRSIVSGKSRNEALSLQQQIKELREQTDNLRQRLLKLASRSGPDGKHQNAYY